MIVAPRLVKSLVVGKGPELRRGIELKALHCWWGVPWEWPVAQWGGESSGATGTGLIYPREQRFNMNVSM